MSSIAKRLQKNNLPQNIKNITAQKIETSKPSNPFVSNLDSVFPLSPGEISKVIQIQTTQNVIPGTALTPFTGPFEIPRTDVVLQFLYIHVQIDATIPYAALAATVIRQNFFRIARAIRFYEGTNEFYNTTGEKSMADFLLDKTSLDEFNNFNIKHAIYLAGTRDLVANPLAEFWIPVKLPEYIRGFKVNQLCLKAFNDLRCEVDIDPAQLQILGAGAVAAGALFTTVELVAKVSSMVDPAMNLQIENNRLTKPMPIREKMIQNAVHVSVAANDLVTINLVGLTNRNIQTLDVMLQTTALYTGALNMSFLNLYPNDIVATPIITAYNFIGDGTPISAWSCTDTFQKRAEFYEAFKKFRLRENFAMNVLLPDDDIVDMYDGFIPNFYRIPNFTTFQLQLQMANLTPGVSYTFQIVADCVGEMRKLSKSSTPMVRW